MRPYTSCTFLLALSHLGSPLFSYSSPTRLFLNILVSRFEELVAYYWLIYIFRFLLASLNIEAILQEPTLHRRRERLNHMKNGLGLEDVYKATIERIKAQGGYKCRLGMGALMWISYAERPLSPDELRHALAIELGSTDFSAANISSIMTLVSCCQGLITVDKEASTVRLIHFTLREYFSTYSDISSRPHSAMTEICLTYLNSKIFWRVLSGMVAEISCAK